MATTLNALWPTITTRRAALSAALISAATTLSAALLYVLVERDAIAQYGTLALLFPALLMVIAWRTWRLSRPWSLFGAILVGLMVAASLLTGPDLAGILLFFGMMTGYRGARAWRRLREVDGVPRDSGELEKTPQP